MIKILILQMQEKLRQTLEKAIAYQADMVFSTINGGGNRRAKDNFSETVLQCRRFMPDLVVVDEERSGFDFAVQMRKELPAIKMVLISKEPDTAKIGIAYKAGIYSYLRQDSAPEDFLFAIRRSAKGRGIYPGVR